MEAPKLAVKNKKSKKMDDWEIKDCVDCITRAEEIKADPEKMKQIMPHMKKRMNGMKKAISSISDLRALSKEKEASSEDMHEDMYEDSKKS